MILFSVFLQSWWSAPLDEKESENEIDAIDLISPLLTNSGTRNRLEMVSKCSDLVFSCNLDNRFLLMKKSPKLKLIRLTWFSHYKLILGKDHMNKIWVKKSIKSIFKSLWLTFLLYSWWSVRLDEKEPETEIDAIDLIFSH